MPSYSLLALSFAQLVNTCSPSIHPQTMKALVNVESGFNPYAIGVVGQQLERQPKTKGEAIVTAQSLEKAGYNFSLGLTQVNRYNLIKYNVTYDDIFEPCINLKVGGDILNQCYTQAKQTGITNDQTALQSALSCYYSGNFTRGFQQQDNYVQRVVNSSVKPIKPVVIVPAIDATVPVPIKVTSSNKVKKTIQIKTKVEYNKNNLVIDSASNKDVVF